jgi:hypothetical protein
VCVFSPVCAAGGSILSAFTPDEVAGMKSARGEENWQPRRARIVHTQNRGAMQRRHEPVRVFAFAILPNCGALFCNQRSRTKAFVCAPPLIITIDSIIIKREE